LDYLHNNPVEEGLVFRAEQYVYSSAVDEKKKIIRHNFNIIALASKPPITNRREQCE